MTRTLRIAGVTTFAALALCCATAAKTGGNEPVTAAPVPVKEVRHELAALGAPTRDGNTVSVINNGAVFDTLVDEINKARHSVHIVLFIWRKSTPSDRVVNALLARAADHLECRIVLDPLASPNFAEEVYPSLKQAGCDVRYYKPIKQTLTEGGDGIERTHRKIVVLDGERAMTGGFGIWKSWEGDGLSKEEWRDTNALIRGPVVADLQRTFEETWRRVDGPALPKTAYPKLEPIPGGNPAAFIGSDATEGERRPDQKTSGEELAELLIGSARKRLWISNSYFVPTEKMIHQLEAKARAGVDVRVLAPGPVHDWRTVRNAQREAYSRLIDAGVRIFEYQPSMMHSKVFLVDDQVASIGSMNLDPLSLKQLEEGQLVVWDPKVAAKLDQDLQRDFLHSQERKKEWPGPLEVAARAFLWMIGRR